MILCSGDESVFIGREIQLQHLIDYGAHSSQLPGGLSSPETS